MKIKFPPRMVFSVVTLILLSTTVLVAQTVEEILGAHIDFAMNDPGTPIGDCNPGHAACCATGPQGLFARNVLGAQAAAAAKAGNCGGAIALLVVTQCHNPDAAALIAQNNGLACQILQSY